MKRTLRIAVIISCCCLFAYICFAVVYSLFKPRPAVNIQIENAVATANKHKMTVVNKFWRFDSASLPGNKTILLHYTITNWVKGADTTRLSVLLKKFAFEEIKSDKRLEEFKDSSVLFNFQYLDSINAYTYNFTIAPGNYK